MILEDITGHPVKGLYFHCAMVGQGKTRAMLTHACELTKKGKVLYVNDEDNLTYLFDLLKKRIGLINPNNIKLATLPPKDWSTAEIINYSVGQCDHLFIDCYSLIPHDYSKLSYELKWIKDNWKSFKSIHFSVQTNFDGYLPSVYNQVRNVIYYEKVSSLVGLQLRGSLYYTAKVRGVPDWFEFNAVD